MSRSGVNFTALMRDASGRVVPGSVRQGHNVMTSAGRDLLTELAVWSAFGLPDVPYTSRRARWIGVGGGTQPETEDVVSLATPLPWASGSEYLKVLDSSLTVFPTITSVSVKAVFGLSEITWALPAVVVSEAGLFFDVMSSGSSELNEHLPNNVPAFYKTFEPLVKLNSFSMEILWELKF